MFLHKLDCVYISTHIDHPFVDVTYDIQGNEPTSRRTMWNTEIIQVILKGQTGKHTFHKDPMEPTSIYKKWHDGSLCSE